MKPKNIASSLFLILIALPFFFLFNSCSKSQNAEFAIAEDLVLIKGGGFTNQKLQLHRSNVSIADFYIGKKEVSQKEWFEVMGTNPSRFKLEGHPVEMITWYDAIVYCNKRSLQEALDPFYQIDSLHIDEINTSPDDSIKWTVNINNGANGYRLPTELEWVYAASGGQSSESFAFSGADSIAVVAWYWQNSGDKPQGGYWDYNALEGNNSRTHKIGSKKPNELGLYDMSGNVYELCQDWYEEEGVPPGASRVIRGGSWAAVELTCELAFRHFFVPNNRSGDVGFRVCRSK